ncbi:RNA pyrophosphohydrolase [Rickettsiales bacterium LUAb2]
MTNNLLYRPGVGIFLINNKQQVLIGKRIKPKDVWQLPQGGVDDGETQENAVMRELYEEIGTQNVKILAKTPPLKYSLPKEVANTCFNGKYQGQEQVWFAMQFLGNDNDINLNATNEPEFLEWRWENPNNLVDIIVDFKKDLYKAVLNYMLEFKVI